MTDVAVYINGLKLDIAKTQEVAQTFAVNSFGDISSRNSAYSNTWEAPFTANNKAILENSEIVVNSSTIPYQRLTCLVYADGMLVVNGYAELISTKESYKLRVYGGNYDFFSSIKGLLLTDLDISDLDHLWNITNIAASRLNTEGYIYPLIDYHSDSPNSYVNNTDREVDVRTLFPAVFIHTLIDRIITAAGFTKSGALFNDDNYKSLVIPYANDKLGYSEAYVLNQKFRATIVTPQQFLYNGTLATDVVLSEATDETTSPNFDNGGHWSLGSKFTADGSILTRFSVAYTISHVGVSGLNLPFFDVYFYVNGVLTQTEARVMANYTVLSNWFSLNAGDYVEVKFKQTLIDTTSSVTVTSVQNNGTGTAQLVGAYHSNIAGFVAGNTYYIDVAGYVGNYLVTAVSNTGLFGSFFITINTPFVATGTGKAWIYTLGQVISQLDTCVISNEVREDINWGSNMPMSSTLPKLKQADLLKCILQKFGAIVQVDNENKVVHVRQFSEIVDNIPNALNWSDKVDAYEEAEMTFKLDKYAQLNNFKYKEDDSVIKPLATDYQLPIANENLPTEVDLIESLFAASEMILRFEDLDVPQIKKFVAGAEVDKVKPRILSLVQSDIDSAAPFTYHDPVNSTSVIVYTSLPFVHFILQSQDFNLGWVDLVNDHSSEIRDVLQNTKIIKELLRLNNTDINQLDFFTPIWLDKHKRYFYISEITQYKFTSKESTVVELVKLI